MLHCRTAFRTTCTACVAFVCLAWCSLAAGQQQLKPETAGTVSTFLVDVAGPDTVPAGDLAVFDVGKSTATKFAWTIIPSSKNFRVDSSLRMAYLSGVTGTYTLVLVGTDAEGNVAIDTQTTTLGGRPAPDDPDPPGPPDPKPVPEGFLGLTKTVYMASGKLPAPLKKFLPELADSFESHGSAIAAGKGLEGALAELTTKNRQILAGLSADDRSTVTNVVFKEIEAVMDAAAKNGKLSKPEQYSEALIDVAAGLRLAK